MEYITYDDITALAFPNVKEILDQNTNGYKVTPTFSNSTDIPCLVVNITSTPTSTSQEYETRGIATVRIKCITTSKKDAGTLSQEIISLMKTNVLLFKDNGMQFQEYVTNDLDFERNSQRLHGKELVYNYYVG